MSSLDSDAQTWSHHRMAHIHTCRNFDAHEWAPLYNIIHWPDDLYISVKIDATVVIQNPKTGIVAYKSELAGLISLGGIRNDVDIKVIFIPFLDFIIREELAPTIDAFYCTFG